MLNSNGSFAEGYAIGRDSSGNGGNGNGMWGDSWAWIIIILAVLWGGWGRNGFGGGNGGNDGCCCNGGNGGVSYVLPYPGAGFGGGTYTDASIQRSFDNQAVVSKLDGITQGICDGFYAVNTSLLNGFNGVDNAICNLGYQTQNGFNATQVAMMHGNNAIQTQLADCCCTLKTGQLQTQNVIQNTACETGRAIERGFADTNYNLATQACALQTALANSTRDIVDNQRDGTRAILDYLANEKISSLQSENQSLRLAASQANQNNVIRAAIDASTAEIIRRTGNDCPLPAYVVQPPTPVTFGTNCCGTTYCGAGYNNGYNGGCNSGCCGCNG